ncbi:hypothetical protein G647_07160 [Cladophialophora carrionii CBS 160.54]|uniref:Uncharacterized protein n=1 Tax=Cladophialophora carrionii CBS 160.54 TaxID=1279043 RepID=V9D3E1_9EURO|nr:uncharacterized protein G647_07160 [Cladophialophora carrionii CBS 160.54]ETI20818.1 hypothetical protein G647_07160 [Cladophialophora carrionii CBS 160.54]
MQFTTSVRLIHALLALHSLTAVTAAQALSIDSNGCYWTSTVVFGNITSSSTVPNTFSTTSGGRSISPILPSSTVSNPSTSESIVPTTSGPPIITTTSSLASSESTASSFSSTLPTATPPAPASTLFRITVSGFNARLRPRAPSYLSFNGENAYLIADEELSGIFVLTSDGQLRTGDATVGINGRTGSLPLRRFPGLTQPSGYIWYFNDTRLVFGENLAFSALSDGQMFVTFPGGQPPTGAVQLGLEPEFVETMTSSTLSTTSNLASMSSSPGTGAMTTTTYMETSVSRPATGGPYSTTPSIPSSQVTSSTTTPGALSPSAMTPDQPLTSSTTAYTTTVLLPQSTSVAASGASSSTSLTPSPSLSSNTIISSSSGSTTTIPPSVASSSSAAPSTTVQGNPTTLLSSTTTNVLTSNAIASSLPATSASSTMSPSLGTTISSTTLTNGPSSSMTSSRVTTAVTSTQPQPLSTTLSPSAQSTNAHSSSSVANPNPTSITTTTRSPSSTSSSLPTSTPTSSPYPAKRGLAYRNVTTLQYYPPPSPYISWTYNYYSLPNASDDVGAYPYPSAPYRFIPLLYNDAPSLTSIWSSNVNFSITHYGTDAIFGFNEPDANFDGQSANMPVAQSIQGYATFMEPFAGRVRIGCPAVTNTGGGIAYLEQFLGNASLHGLTLDFINLHWYASPYNIDYFREFVTQAYSLSVLYSPNITSRYVDTRNGGEALPVWITEFGLDQNNYDWATNVAFLKNASRWMDQQVWVERYAWFGNFPGGLTSYGAPTTGMLLNTDGSGRSALGDVWYRYNGTS